MNKSLFQVKKLEQHNSSAFELSRAFKFFDKNHSQTIDVDELVSVLKSFALELNSTQLDAVLDRFQAKVIPSQSTTPDPTAAVMSFPLAYAKYV